MEQFSLDKWLKDKSRKITTRLGNREVRIICWDRKNSGNKPIITLMIDPDGNEYTTFHTKNGFVDDKEKYMDKRDLFFADKEDDLTEFEKEVEMMMVSFSNGNFGSNVIKEMPKQKLYSYSHRLLDFARKEILKDLPNWKKCDDNLPYSHIGGLNEMYLIKGGYFIKISDLETLPKEE